TQPFGCTISGAGELGDPCGRFGFAGEESLRQPLRQRPAMQPGDAAAADIRDRDFVRGLRAARAHGERCGEQTRDRGAAHRYGAGLRGRGRPGALDRLEPSDPPAVPAVPVFPAFPAAAPAAARAALKYSIWYF